MPSGSKLSGALTIRLFAASRDTAKRIGWDKKWSKPQPSTAK